MVALRLLAISALASFGSAFLAPQSPQHRVSPAFMMETAVDEVSVGFKIPSVTLMEGTGDFEKDEVNIAELIAGKKVAIFGVPGAFTPGCSKSHLPSFIDAQDELKAKGVEMTICIATNDLYVMEVRDNR
jgi:predicted peroxiredoxin